MPDERSSALLVVDVQNDFCPGGALAVFEGDAVVPVINALARRAADAGAPVFASRDWHPARTSHFKTYGGPWPEHCVAGTEGAEFHPRLELPAATMVVTTGDDPGTDGYSAFDGHLDDGRSLGEALAAHGVSRLIVTGLATDYCVRASVLDARRAGLDVVVVIDAIRGVEVHPGDSARALAEMRAAGASITESSKVVF
jgi:nicotinamidase/pyrazinamidase